jgi:hypothetical protein
MAVYPAKQQTATQLSKDESDCYSWSRTQSGYDPLAPKAPVTASQSQSPQPAHVARGAAGGAAIGAIAGNAGAGAAAGAGLGAVRRHRAQKEQQAAQQSAQEQAQATEQQNLDSFKRGMQACLESRGYTVR